MAIRSFLAFELPLDIKKTVEEVLDQAKQYDLSIKWVPLMNIHLTVVFLGNIQEQDIPDIGEGIEKSCSQTAVFHISLDNMGCFPNKRNPRVLWLGLKGEIKRMSIFRDEIQNQLLPFGITQEKRPFRPHLTLGRFKKSDKKNSLKVEKLIESYQQVSGPEQILPELVQFRSDLRPGGAVYTKIASWPLAQVKGIGQSA